MAEDIKTLTKKNAALEQRLKIAEAKIKALADNMTNPKDIQKFMNVVAREQTDMDKRFKREQELATKVGEAEWKIAQKENDKISKEIQKMNKHYVKEAELSVIKARLANVESLVHAALSKR